MVLPDLFAQRGPFPRNTGNNTPGLGVLNALTQQIKQSSLHSPKGDQWKEFHQLLKGALQQARQDIRETRRDDRHQAIREAHQERENRIEARAEARIAARLEARIDRLQDRIDACRDVIQDKIQTTQNAIDSTAANPASEASDMPDTPLVLLPEDANNTLEIVEASPIQQCDPNDNVTLDQLIMDLRKLGLTLPGEHVETTTDIVPNLDASTEETISTEQPTGAPLEKPSCDDSSLLDALPSITAQLNALLPQLPLNEQALLTQALGGLEQFSALVSTEAKPVATTEPTIATDGDVPAQAALPIITTTTNTPTLPTAVPVVASLQESIKNVVKALPEEAKEALKQVFQLLNDAKQARHIQANTPTQVAEAIPAESKPAFDSTFIHPLQALLRHLGDVNEAKIAQTASGQFTSTGDNNAYSQSNQFKTFTPILADMVAAGNADIIDDSTGMSEPFNSFIPTSNPVFDPTNVALSTTISMNSRIGMTNPIAQNRPQPVNQPIQSQVVEAAQIAVKNGKNELIVQLNPQHLGKVTVTLTSDANKQVTAVLVTESNHVQGELQKDIKTFIRSMEQHGVNLVKVSVIQANTEAQHSHNAAQDREAQEQSQQQQSMNHQGSNNPSGSHSQREAFEWRQQFINHAHFNRGDSDIQDVVETLQTPTAVNTSNTPTHSEINLDGGVDLRA